jgi:hypothetical protein
MQADYHCSHDNSRSGLQVNKPVDNNSSHTNRNASVMPLMMRCFLKETAKESYFTGLAVKDNAREKGEDKV